MAGNFFRGTSVEQDGRFGKSDERLMAKMSKAGKFSPILDTKVNMKKVNIDFMSKWITAKIIQVVGFEDDIVINLIINLLEGDVLDPKKMQLDVTGFLEKQAQSFVEELWTLLVDAQNQTSGIPSIFIQQKKEEIINREQLKTQQSHAVTQREATDSDIVKSTNDQTARGQSQSHNLRTDETSSARPNDRSSRGRDSSSPRQYRRKEDSSRSRDRGSSRHGRDERSRRDDSRDRHSSDRRGRGRDDSRDNSSRHRPSDSSDRGHHSSSSRRHGDRDSRERRGGAAREKRHPHHRDEDHGRRDSSRHRGSSRRSRSNSSNRGDGGRGGVVLNGSAAVVNDVEGKRQRRSRSNSSSSSEGGGNADDRDRVVPL